MATSVAPSCTTCAACGARPPRSRKSATPTESGETDVEERRPAKLSFGQHTWAFVKELTAVVIGAIIVSSLLRAFVGQMFVIPSVSMENTLLVNDRVVVEKLSSVQRGQVVVFEDPGNWLTGVRVQERGPVGQALEFIGVLPDSGTEHLIKRLVGMPGDRVVCCDKQGRISVNGRALDETAYLYTASDGQQVKPSRISFDVTVPAGRIFVLGDNRGNSRDSRCHLNDTQPGGTRGENAFVSLDLVVGRAVAVAWPIADLKTLSVPQTYAGLPPGGPPPVAPVIQAGPEARC